MNKVSVGDVVARSKRLWKDKGDSYSPQPNRNGREQRSAISHYGMVSQGELDGDKTFNADQREMTAVSVKLNDASTLQTLFAIWTS